MIVSLYIENDKLDLFGDENIQITSAVADINDITKNFTDYSRVFTVPASDVNNRIFKHYYNANIDNTFDARLKVNSFIYLDGILFKEGKARLSEVEVKKGRPSSYTLNFWGNLLSISKRVQDDKLSDLDLSFYDHPYTSTNVFTGLTSSLFGGDLVYSLFSKKQLYYNSEITDDTDTDTLTNIAYQEGNGTNGVQYNELKPSLKNIRIIEAIESKYNLTFTRDFFGRTEFTNTFLWLNNKEDAVSGGGRVQVDFDSGDFTFIDPITDIGTYEVGQISGFINTFYNLELRVTPSVGFENIAYTVIFYKNGSVSREVFFANGGQRTVADTLSIQGTNESIFTHEIYYEIKTDDAFNFSTRLRQINIFAGTVDTFSSEQIIGSNFIVSDNIQEIKVIDYLKGFFQAFKLVVVPVSENELYVNTLNDFYKEGDSFDITKYVDQESYKVQRGNLLSEIEYRFEDPTTILNTQFKKNTLTAYGDEDLSIKEDPNDPNSELIDGGKEEFSLPFEVIIYDRLRDIDDTELTNIMYAPIIDENLNSANPKSHLHYNINIDLSAKSFGLIDESNNKLEVTQVNNPFHCDQITEPLYALLFGQEFNEWDGSLMANTLYSNYHAEYIEGIFNIKRRDYKYTSYLPLNILSKLTLNDVLRIGNDFYRIDKYTTNLTTGKTDLELVTAFEVNINRVVANETNIFVSYIAQDRSVFVTNLNNPVLTKIDTGFGVSWLTLSINGSNLVFTFTENSATTDRSMNVQLVQGLFTILFIVVQSGNTILENRLSFDDPNNIIYYTTILGIKQ